jgi:hypothetical protein
MSHDSAPGPVVDLDANGEHLPPRVEPDEQEGGTVAWVVLLLMATAVVIAIAAAWL